MMIKSLSRSVLHIVFLVAWLWGLATIHFGPWPMSMKILVGVFWGMVAIEYLRPFNLRRRWPRFLFAMILINLVWAFDRPTGEGNWSSDQANMPHATFTNEKNTHRVTIENVRNASYRSDTDFDVVWETREYDLDTIETVDFVIEPFAMNGSLAHTFVTFGFANGEHVAISAEVRKQQGQSFSPLKGIFKQFELAYVVADERDVIGLRTNIRHHNVRLYRCTATADQVRQLFVAMLQRANQLAEHPEFYHSVFNSCTSNITWHLEQLGWQDRRLDRRLLFPGRADEVGFERGLLTMTGTVAETRAHALINSQTKLGVDGKAWSAQIRARPTRRSTN